MKAYGAQTWKWVIIRYCNRNCWCLFLLCLLIWFLLLSYHHPSYFTANSAPSFGTLGRSKPHYLAGDHSDASNPSPMGANTAEIASQQPSEVEMEMGPVSDPCSGRYIYVHDIPARFNRAILDNCSLLNKWLDMCPSLHNIGLGPRAVNSNGVLQNEGWFLTSQFMLETIFHERMKQYGCLTNDSAQASAIYVPYYAGLDVGRYLWDFNASVRDAGPLGLVKWLGQRAEWKHMWGRDHFFVAGRITWDFRRQSDDDAGWGNKLMSLPGAQNMTMLVIESSPWSSKDFAIPYPTFFHPSSHSKVVEWQDRLRRQRRRLLFSFVGAPRPNLQSSIRGDITIQCLASKGKCKLLNCNSLNCNNPVRVIKMFRNSIFCLQPPGDSYTRRSIFDSILAGCIPVFFHPGSAYVQYLWHLPKNYTKYSVFIPENAIRNGQANIEKTLLNISKHEVPAMREEVIRLIPNVIYADPRSRLENVDDAFDISVKGVLERVNAIRMEKKEGRSSSIDFQEKDSWKYYLFGSVKKHEWDPFFWKTYS